MNKFKKGSRYNDSLQKGNKVNWFDGHKKGTGVVVKPIMGEPYDIRDGKPYHFGFAEKFEVKDDITGKVMEFDINNIQKIPSNRDIKEAKRR